MARNPFQWYKAVMNQWFLFTGDNAYERFRERGRWLKAFAEKHGSENIQSFEASGLSKSALMNEVASAPFIAEKRLIVINGLPKVEKDDVEELITATHPGVLVVCEDPKPDKRLGSTKAFLEHLDVRQFPLKSRQEILLWLRAAATELGVQLSADASAAMIDRIGEDQQMLSSEITKIATYVGRGGTIAVSDIDELIVFRAERVAWQLMDHFAAGKKRDALSLAHTMLLKGENPHSLWSRLLWMVTQVMLVAAAVDRGCTQPAAIAKEAGVPFPTARNLSSYAGSASRKNLRRVCAWFSDADKGLKLGAYRATAEAPEELVSIIDSGIVRLSALAGAR